MEKHTLSLRNAKNPLGSESLLLSCWRLGCAWAVTHSAGLSRVASPSRSFSDFPYKCHLLSICPVSALNLALEASLEVRRMRRAGPKSQREILSWKCGYWNKNEKCVSRSNNRANTDQEKIQSRTLSTSLTVSVSFRAQLSCSIGTAGKG